MRLAALLVVAALGTCAPAGPDDAYREFAVAYQNADVDGAWRLLSRGTKDELTRAAKAAARAEHVDAPDDGRLLVFEGGRPQGEVTEVEVKSETGDRAVVEATDDHGDHDVVPLVREPDGWKVDLEDALEKAAAK